MKNTFYIFLVLFIAFACKKDKKIERNLWKDGGEWEIISFEESYYKIPASQFNYSAIINNGGSIQFNKDGTGKFNYSPELAEYLEDVFYEEQINAEFKYHFTENSLFFIIDEIEGLGFDLEWEKDKMTYSYYFTKTHYDLDANNDTIYESKETTVNTLKFNCEKK